MNRRQAAWIVGAVLLGLIGVCGLCLATGLTTYLIRETTPPMSNATDFAAIHETQQISSPTTPSSILTLAPSRTATQAIIPARTSAVTASNSTQSPTDVTLAVPFTATTAPTATATPSPTMGPLAFDAWCIPWHTEASRARVLQIIDAITIEVEIGEEQYLVRYIGLSLPDEISAPGIQTLAAEKNRTLVEGKNIMLIKDISEFDEEGRLLRYVIADGVFVNQALADNGYAQVAIVPPDTSCQFSLREAADHALENQRGMWALPATPTRPVVLHPTATIAQIGEIVITTIQPKGTGRQDPDEFVEFRNFSAYPVQLRGWRLSDLKGHTFVFPDFIIYAGNYCRIYTNDYRPENCGLSFFSLSPVWDDLEDCAYLYNSAGSLVDEYCYGW